MIADDFHRFPPLKVTEWLPRGCILLANEENLHVRSAIRKICERPEPGAVIMLTADEFNAITDPTEFQAIRVQDDAQ